MLTTELATHGKPWHGEVIYRDGPIEPNAYTFSLAEIDTYSDDEVIDRLIEAGITESFFTKTKDWETEAEYRFVVPTRGMEPLLVYVRDVLRAIILGEFASQHYKPSIMSLLEQPGVKELNDPQSAWGDGAPFDRHTALARGCRPEAACRTSRKERHSHGRPRRGSGRTRAQDADPYRGSKSDELGLPNPGLGCRAFRPMWTNGPTALPPPARLSASSAPAHTAIPGKLGMAVRSLPRRRRRLLDSDRPQTERFRCAGLSQAWPKSRKGVDPVRGFT